MKKLLFIASLLALVGVLCWPAQAAESIKLNPTDQMAENIQKVTYVDDDDWAATDCHFLIGGLYGSNTITSGDTGPIHIDTNGDVQVDVLSFVPGTAAASLGKAEDGTHANADTGVLLLTVRDDTAPAATASATGKYGALITNATGELYVADETAEDYLTTIDVDTGRIGITQRAAATTMHNAIQLDDSPTTATSSALDMSSYDKFMLYVNVDSTLAPTDLTIQVQFSDDDSTYYNYMNGPYGDLRYEDTATASGLTECLSGDAAGKYMKVVITATGTNATNYFTVTVKVEPYK